MRIESCNFKSYSTNIFNEMKYFCKLTCYGKFDHDMKECSGEDDCVIFQSYKLLEMNTK